MIWRGIGILILIPLLIGMAVTPSSPVAFVEASEPISPEAIYDLVLPGVAFIVTIIEAQIKVPYIDSEGNPTADFFTVYSMIGGFGSGFFVNNDGYIVTNGHVILAMTHSDYLEDIFVKTELVRSAAFEIINSWIEAGYDVTQEDVEFVVNYVMRYGEVMDAIRTVFVVVGESTGGNIREDGIAARVIGTPDPFFGRDLAVLKIDIGNTPSLPLSEEDVFQPGQNVYAFGYPGVVNFHQALSEDTRLFPSYTSGIISGERRTFLDVRVIQTDVAISKGNSGGPVVNDKGEVVGVANMGSVDENLDPVAGFNFFVPVDIVRQYLNEQGVSYNTRGPIDQMWEEGIGYYYAGLYSRAKNVFENVRNLYPFNWYASFMIQKAQNRLAEGAKSDATLTLEANATEVQVGQAVEISGRLSYDGPNPLGVDVSFKDVLLDVTIQLGGSVETRTVRVGEDNTFSLTYTPSTGGDLVVTASFVGDEDFNPASSTVTIKVASPGIPLWMIALPILAAIGVGAYLFLRRGGLGVKMPSRAPAKPIEGALYCPSCGHANKPGAKFCVKCGSRLEG